MRNIIRRIVNGVFTQICSKEIAQFSVDQSHFYCAQLSVNTNDKRKWFNDVPSYSFDNKTRIFKLYF